MTHKDDGILNRFRATGPCELCGKQGGREPHHVRAKGLGAGGRMDVPINLIAICRCCHRMVHDGYIRRCDVLERVAEREYTTPHAIQIVVAWLLKLDKHTSAERVASGFRRMRPDVAALSKRTWQEMQQCRKRNQSTAPVTSAKSTGGKCSRSKRTGAAELTF